MMSERHDCISANQLPYLHTWSHTTCSVHAEHMAIYKFSAKPHMHTQAIAQHKPHSDTRAHSCRAHFPTAGWGPDAACQCTSLSEPQAAAFEEETDGYQLVGWEPWAHSYCIAPHKQMHTHAWRAILIEAVKLQSSLCFLSNVVFVLLNSSKGFICSGKWGFQHYIS